MEWDDEEYILSVDASVYIKTRLLHRPSCLKLHQYLRVGDTVIIPGFHIACDGADLARTIQMWVGMGIYVHMIDPYYIFSPNQETTETLDLIKKSADCRPNANSLAGKQLNEEERINREHRGTIHNIPFGFCRAPGSNKKVVRCWDEIAIMRLAYFLTMICGIGKSAAGRRIRELYSKRGKLPPQRRRNVRKPRSDVSHERVRLLLVAWDRCKESIKRYKHTGEV